ncbi:hypothetical protein CS022_23305 [Veronia nyctiphanis]|uniref:HTH cro/C1-type domain-containing protein n=1 Tax=Veronia nyctiphanis TaxID=1278244 RepID=A0A4Q0YI63_9GAMM|nr:helix-turn-helix transcriptional regulator [Veronia nyctiphanis]RXJ70406.1 hypothetical protein CS022_23305 [Veronia nyctiphanis]
MNDMDVPTIQTETVKLHLQRLLADRGVTYRDIAETLSISERSVKRLFQQFDSVPLQRLSQLCSLAGLTLNELWQIAEKSQQSGIEFTEAQCTLFINEPVLYWLWTATGRTQCHWATLESYFDWTEAELYQQLRKLEKVGLLTIGPQNKIVRCSPIPSRYAQGHPIVEGFKESLTKGLLEVESNAQDSGAFGTVVFIPPHRADEFKALLTKTAHEFFQTLSFEPLSSEVRPYSMGIFMREGNYSNLPFDGPKRKK